jgi:hypothetical protein
LIINIFIIALYSIIVVSKMSAQEMKHFKARAPNPQVRSFQTGDKELRQYQVRNAAVAYSGPTMNSPTTVTKLSLVEMDFGDSIQASKYMDSVGSKYASQRQRCSDRRLQMASARALEED